MCFRITTRIAPWTACAVCLLTPLKSAAESVTLVPVADTTLFETTATNNLGAEPTFVSGTTASGFKNRAVMKFDVAAQIPPGATITSATLNLTVAKVNPLSSVSAMFDLHRLLQPWGEGAGVGFNTGRAATNGEATWLARFHPADVWSSPGAAANSDYSSIVSSSALIAGPAGYLFASTTNLVVDVQTWLDDTNSNFGWILVCENEGTPFTAHRFSSRENAAAGPALVVEFSVPQTPQPQIDSIQLAGTNVNIQFTVQSTFVLSLEYVSALPSTNWTTLTNVGAPTSPVTVNYSDPLLTDPQRFYRLEVTGQVR